MSILFFLKQAYPSDNKAVSTNLSVTGHKKRGLTAPFRYSYVLLLLLEVNTHTKTENSGFVVSASGFCFA